MTAVLLGLAGPAVAQDSKAADLLDKMIAARGGMHAWENLSDMTFTLARIVLGPQEEVAAAGVSRYSMKRHGKMRVETVTGKGLLVQGFDGQRPWVTLDGRPHPSQAAPKRAHF